MNITEVVVALIFAALVVYIVHAVKPVIVVVKFKVYKLFTGSVRVETSKVDKKLDESPQRSVRGEVIDRIDEAEDSAQDEPS